MQNDRVKCIYKGSTYYGNIITSGNIEKIREDVKVGHYGVVEEGLVVFYMRSGFDGFYMILSQDDADLQIFEDK